MPPRKGAAASVGGACLTAGGSDAIAYSAHARVSSLRGVHKGLVHDGADLNQLPAVGIEGEEGEANARRWIDRAVAENAWLILFTHDVRENPSAWGCTPGALDRLAAHARSHGREGVLTFHRELE